MDENLNIKLLGKLRYNLEFQINRASLTPPVTPVEITPIVTPIVKEAPVNLITTSPSSSPSSLPLPPSPPPSTKINCDVFNDNNRLENFRVIDADAEIRDICVLPNQCLLSASHRSLTLYDKNLNVIKKLSKIGNKKVLPSGVTTNGKDRIYISDQINHQIIMTDLNFSKLKITGSGSNGLTSPECPFYADGYLYVPDRLNSRIKKLDSDTLDLIDTYTLNFSPLQVKVIGNTMCIKPEEKPHVYFYTIMGSKLILRYKYEHDMSRISVLNGYFYEYCPLKSIIHRYDCNGAIIEPLKPSSKWFFNDDYDKWTGNLVLFNDRIIISSCGSRKLIEISS